MSELVLSSIEAPQIVSFEGMGAVDIPATMVATWRSPYPEIVASIHVFTPSAFRISTAVFMI